jgi:glycosyltransferase involved in cell wall biosynthesis
MIPKVSILIPTFNRAGFLREAIASALSQTERETEVLVLDDASPDQTPSVVKEFSGDPRVRYVRHERNLGIAGNWRRGMELALGEYFCLLHDDDTFEPDFVAELMRPLVADPGLILSFCDHFAMDAQGNRLATRSDEISARFARQSLAAGRVRDLARTALVDVSIPVGATLFRRSMVSPAFIAEEARGAIDAWLLYECVRTGHGAFYVAKRLMNYRIHGDGMSVAMPLAMSEGHLFRHRRILAEPALASIHPATAKALTAALVDYGIGLLATGRPREARRVLWQSLQRSVGRRNSVAFGLSCLGRIGTRAIRFWRQRRAAAM